MRLTYLVWTLPIQKLLLVAGLFFVHGHVLEPKDLLAVVPEAVFALLVTSIQIKYQRIRWFRAALGLIMTVLAFASWVVIVPWVVSGTPLPYQQVSQFARGSATLKTVIYSWAILIQVLVWIAAFLSLCTATLLIASWVEKRRVLPTWLQRTEVVIFLGIIIALHIFSSEYIRPTNRFALVALVYNDLDLFSSTSLSKNWNPRAMSVLRPPHRHTPSTKLSDFKNVLLILLESIRYQPESMFDKDFPQGYHFNRAYAHHPRSVKTVEALLFGIYPSVSLLTAAWGIDNYDTQKMWPLPWILQQNGYSGTYYAAMDPGYDNYRAFLKASGFDKVEIVTDGNQLTWGVCADTLFSKVAETLENPAGEKGRQFIMVWTAECHQPYDFIGQRNKLEDPLTRYLLCQDSLAHSLKNLLKRLGISGILDKTLIIVLGDHGQIFQKEKEGEWGHGQHVYEQSVRIPILMFVPGKEGKWDNDRLFQIVDVPATILSLLNIPVPQSWVGRNMLDPREPGRDFVVLLSTLSDGIVGVLQKSGVKYVRNKPNEPMVSYQTNRDPYEQIPLPISKETELEIEKIIDTYLDVATQGWESKKMSNDLFSQSYLGAEIARNWGNDPCIEIVPDELKKITLVHPVVRKECQNADAFARAIYKMIPSELIGQESRLEFNVMLLRNKEIQGKQPQSLVKIWGMEQPIVLSLQPIANIWQTVSVVLPKFKSSIDSAISHKQNDVFLAIVPVDLPIHYAVGYIVVKPANTNIKQTLRHWSLRFKQYLSKVF